MVIVHADRDLTSCSHGHLHKNTIVNTATPNVCTEIFVACWCAVLLLDLSLGLVFYGQLAIVLNEARSCIMCCWFRLGTFSQLFGCWVALKKHGVQTLSPFLLAPGLTDKE